MPTRFEPLPVQETCNHPEHDPPQHVVIPQGHRMVHTCPGCGHVTAVTPLQFRWSS